MVNSIRKGKAGEREFAKLCRDYGFAECRRGQQYNGLEGEDVVGLPCVHCEVKRVEKLNIHKAMEQSIQDADIGDIPIVAHRKNGKPPLVTMPAEKFLLMLRAVVRKDPGAWIEARYGTQCDIGEGDSR